MNQPKSLIPEREIKKFIWDRLQGMIPVQKDVYLNLPVTPNERVFFYSNRSKYHNNKPKK